VCIVFCLVFVVDIFVSLGWGFVVGWCSLGLVLRLGCIVAWC